MYEKEQVSLELVCEAVTNLLWYFIPDDYAEDEENQITQVIKENLSVLSILLAFIQTPIIASACPGMFNIFREVLFIILPYMCKQNELDLSAKLWGNISDQV